MMSWSIDIHAVPISKKKTLPDDHIDLHHSVFVLLLRESVIVLIM